MRILFVLAHFYPYVGGAETIVKRLTAGLVKRGHVVRVITTRLPGMAACETVEGVLVERVYMPRVGHQYLFSLISLPAIVRQAAQYDLMHTTSNYSALAAFVAARFCRRPIVLTCNEVLGSRWHGVVSPGWKAGLYRLIEHQIVTLPYDRYVAISKATQADLLQTGIDARRAAVVYCGVDEVFAPDSSGPSGKLRALCGIGAQDFLYLYFGRPGVTKGVQYLLQAAPAIQQTIPNAHLVLILAREPRPAYERLCRLIDTLKGKANIHLLPSFAQPEQLAEHLRDANCVVVPSLTEGFGLTTAEACALGVPVVATRVGSIPEVVSGRYTLIEPASSDAIVQGVVRVWRGQFDAGPASRPFTWAQMVTDYEKVYQTLCT